MNRLGRLALCGLVAILAAKAYVWFRPHPSKVGPKPPPVSEAPDSHSSDFYRDTTRDAGVDFTYRNGEDADNYAILESLGGGVGLFDFDADGLLDIFLTGGGSFTGPDKTEITGNPCRLYKNLGNWRFRGVTAEVGLDRIDFYSHGCAVADFNRDGWPDLLVTGYGRIALFQNEPGETTGRTFRDVTDSVGLRRDHFWGTSAAWGDLDGDGYPDLYVCQYVDWSFQNHPMCDGYNESIPRDICSPRQFDARSHALYRNNGNGTFTDVGNEAGLAMLRKPEDYDRLTHLSEDSRERLRLAERDRNFGKGLGVILVDVNDDRRPDIYVANDTTEKFLYLNRSMPGQIRLEEVGVSSGVAVDDRGVPNGSMGVDAGDYDGTGRASLLTTNYENELHALYRNTTQGGELLFDYQTHRSGMASLGRQYVGFGTAFVDFDSDGWQDVVIANGHVIRHPVTSGVRQRPVLLHNQGKQGGEVRFEPVSDRGGDYFRSDHQARGLAVGDLDNDGRPDLVISHVNAPVALLRNEADRRHWFGVELVAKDHADLVGAKVTLEVDGRVQTRFATGGGSYLSSSDRRFVFGLGAATHHIGHLTVVWPSGTTQHWEGQEIDRYWRLQPDAPAQERPR